MSSNPTIGGSSRGGGGDPTSEEALGSVGAQCIETEGKRLTSSVWNDFTRIKTPSGVYIAKCNHCFSSLSANSNNGTSHLRKHLDHACKKRGGQKDVRQQILQASKRAADGSIKLDNYRFDQVKSRRDLAVMIIKHNYPFSIVDHEFFQVFIKGLNPEFKIVSRNTIRADIIGVHVEEKEKIYNILDDLPCRVTLTTDLWTSEHQNIAYAYLTAHFIGDFWNLKKKIINYKSIEYPHDGETLYRFIYELLLEWNIDKKLFAIVVDNATANDVMVRLLKRCLCDKALLPLGGEAFHVRYSAHILNLIAQDGLKGIGGLLNKIRDTVRYLGKSAYGKQNFDSACNQVKLKCKKKVPMDVQNRWNSTYEMLEVAITLKDAFTRVSEIDRSYKHNPSEEDWCVACVVKECLSVFYDATRHFSASNFPTSNVFFGDVCRIHLLLLDWIDSEHDFMRSMARPMKEKIDKYWEESCLIIATAVVLDPRYKMVYVEYFYNKIYRGLASSHIYRVRGCFMELFHEYGGDSIIVGGACDDVGDGTSSSLFTSPRTNHGGDADFGNWLTNSGNTSALRKSEVEQYLEEPVFPRKDNFEILNWWKVNSPKFPTLAKMARDILAVPAATVASESAFSVGGRVIDETRASLLPDIVEALVTTGDWIESTKKMCGEMEQNETS